MTLKRKPLVLVLIGVFGLISQSQIFGLINDTLQLDAGKVSGSTGTSSLIRVFKGIPYAAPPIGNLRWHAPMSVSPWAGVRKADSFSSICPQAPYTPGSFYQLEYFSGPQPPMSEDCLYLNVWTAADSATQKRPVMVWFHGGANVQGYGSEPCFNGEAFAQKGVILVTINYRLGIFGYFAHPALSQESGLSVSGNYAVLDEIASLQWVHRNIAAFGGDTGNVTIFGQSSGATGVNLLMISPQAKGLFHRAILESPSILNNKDAGVYLGQLEKQGVAFATAQGAQSLQQLRGISAANLLSAATASAAFGPNIDGWLLPEPTLNVFARGAQSAVPLLIGSNQDEGAYSAVTAAKFQSDAQARFGVNASAFLNLYPATTDTQAYQSKHDDKRDESFAGDRAEASEQAKLGVPSYLYYFDRVPPGRDSVKYGAFHAAELEYVFNTLSATNRPWQPVDEKLAGTMISYWCNFAATGNPNGIGLPVWPRYDSKTDLSMELGDKVVARSTPDTARLNFLEEVLNIQNGVEVFIGRNKKLDPSFEIANTGITNVFVNKNAISLHVTFFTEKSFPVYFSVFRLSGEVLKRFSVEKSVIGVNELEVSLVDSRNDFCPGSYGIRMSTPDPRVHLAYFTVGS